MKHRILAMVRQGEPDIENRGLLSASGVTVPSAADGYQTGCIFQHTDGSNGTALYVNEGSVTSSSFVPVGTNLTTALVITGVATRAIDIVTSGVFRMGVQETGIPLTTTYPFAMEVQCEANSDITAGATGSSAGIYSRFAIETAQTSQCNHIAVFGKLRPKANLADGNHIGVYGLVEQSAGTISGTSTTVTAAGLFALDISTVNITTGHLNGIVIDSSVASGGTMNATMSGLRIKKTGANRAWPTGIAIDAAAADIGISLSVTTQALTATVTALPANARGARFAFVCATPAMSDGYGAHEVDLTIGGTGTGNATASSAWINIPAAGDAASGGYYCARSDGIWADGSSTITNAIFVFGARMQAQFTDTDFHFLVPFSLNCTVDMDALFLVGTADSKVGIVKAAGGLSTQVGSAALFVDIDGNKYYVKLYSDVAS